jgi:hypothetical protein
MICYSLELNMKIDYGNGKNEFGPGVQIELTAEDIVKAINAYLVAHDVHIRGAMTMRVNKELIVEGGVYVDPSGFVVSDGVRFEGRGKIER